MVDYCYAWAGIFDRRIAAPADVSRRSVHRRGPAWAGGCTCRRRRTPSSARPGSSTGVGSPTSLTQIHDRRQLDFLPRLRLRLRPGPARSRSRAVVAEGDPDVPRPCWPTTSAASSRWPPRTGRDLAAGRRSGPGRDPAGRAGAAYASAKPDRQTAPGSVRPGAAPPGPCAAGTARRGVKQLIVASTFFQCLSLAAAVDAGALPDADERILVLANSSQAPELSVPLQDHQGFAPWSGPASTGSSTWPRCSIPGDRCSSRPAWRSYPDLGAAAPQPLGLGAGPLQIFMDSVQVNPGYSPGRHLRRRRAVTHSDGLMTYSPTRKQPAAAISPAADRAGVPRPRAGADPAAAERGRRRYRVVPLPALGAVIDEVCAADGPRDPLADAGRPTALVLGQYLSSLGLLTWQRSPTSNDGPDAPRRRAAGAEVCVFKPHPSAPPTADPRPGRCGPDAPASSWSSTPAGIAELTMHRHQPEWVISCFSTGLATARYLLGLEAVAVGTVGLLASARRRTRTATGCRWCWPRHCSIARDFEPAGADRDRIPAAGTCSGWSIPWPTACSRRCTPRRRRARGVPEPARRRTGAAGDCSSSVVG